MASKLESDLQDTVDWSRKWLVDFNAVKTHLALFDWSKNTAAIEVKWMGLFLKKSHILRCFGRYSFLNWIGVLTLFLLLKLPLRKSEPLFVLWSLFLLRLICIYKSTMYPFMEHFLYIYIYIYIYIYTHIYIITYTSDKKLQVKKLN